MVGSIETENIHIYYSHKTAGKISLDVDDAFSYGPETITLENVTEGKYQYYIQLIYR